MMQLIDDARQFWRLWSVRIMAIPVLLAGAYASSPAVFTGLIAYVPEKWRPLALFLGTVVMSGIGTLARVVKQGPRDA
ncbi:MAG: hypothetical protein KGM49_00685 [Sphingomonadales bacterium]|nr:hypothetical protein [Sphingomonadales bacterium]